MSTGTIEGIATGTHTPARTPAPATKCEGRSQGWLRRLTRAERFAVGLASVGTLSLIAVMLVALHLMLRDYVIHFERWPI